MSAENVARYKAALLNYVSIYGNSGPNTVEELIEVSKIDDLYFELTEEEQEQVDREMLDGQTG